MLQRARTHSPLQYLCLFGPIGRQTFPPWLLIGGDLFKVSTATEVPSVLLGVLVSWPIGKQKWSNWPLIG